MKTYKVWRVTHHQNDRGDLVKVRYVTTPEIAEEMANQPWAFCGATGNVEEVELVVYDTVEEVLNESR